MRQKLSVNKKDFDAVFEEENEGGYSVWVPDLPGCTSQGETLQEAIDNIQEAICLYLEDNKNLIKNTGKRLFTLPITVCNA